MLLRTSSAPVLSALNASFSQAEVCKDPLEPPNHVHTSNLSSFQSLASPSPHPSLNSHGNIYAGDDSHMGLSSEKELDRASRPWRLSRAQSEGDLACFSVAMAPAGHSHQGSESALHTERSRRLPGASSHPLISPFNMKESILEEVDEPAELLSPLSMRSSSFPRIAPSNMKDMSSHAHGFVLNDGELFTSLKLNPVGSPVACNDKGCRPLTESECKQLGFLDMASGVGSDPYKWDQSHHSVGLNFDSRGAYYQNLLKSDPENPLLLDNYAQYLTKKGEAKKAEEYYERAILADPNDGEVLSHYAKLQWDVNRDQDRAEAYYGQAVQAAPDDCYVMASYASFLWDVEDETNPSASQSSAYGATPPTSSPLLASA